MHRALTAVVAVAVVAGASAVGAGGCVLTRNTTQLGHGGTGRVYDLRLSETRGEVGKPFRAEVSWSDNFITRPEVSVSGLPPGLRYDPATHAVVGTPGKAGFFQVDLGVRQKPTGEPGHRPTADERWWPATVELDIYKPVSP